MPKIERVKPSDEYQALCAASDAKKENNDCTVKALALVCGIDYEAAHKTMEGCGRAKKKGINMTKNLRCALGEHGFKATKVDMKAKIAKYPYGHKKLQNVTTHHPQRFPWVWNDGKTYLFFVRKHVAAVIDGRTHDWSEGRAKRCVEIYEITRKEK